MFTAAVDAAVIRPFASIVKTGIALPEPTEPAETPLFANDNVCAIPSPEVAPDDTICPLVPATVPT